MKWAVLWPRATKIVDHFCYEFQKWTQNCAWKCASRTHMSRELLISSIISTRKRILVMHTTDDFREEYSSKTCSLEQHSSATNSVTSSVIQICTSCPAKTVLISSICIAYIAVVFKSVVYPVPGSTIPYTNKITVWKPYYRCFQELPSPTTQGEPVLRQWRLAGRKVYSTSW